MVDHNLLAPAVDHNSVEQVLVHIPVEKVAVHNWAEQVVVHNLPEQEVAHNSFEQRVEMQAVVGIQVATNSDEVQCQIQWVQVAVGMLTDLVAEHEAPFVPKRMVDESVFAEKDVGIHARWVVAFQVQAVNSSQSNKMEKRAFVLRTTLQSLLRGKCDHAKLQLDWFDMHQLQDLRWVWPK